MFQEFVMRVWRALWPKPKKPVKKRKPLTRHPSLDRAIARISRAEEHLADLMRRTALRGQEQVNAMAIQPHPNEPKQILIKRGEVPLDHGFSILVGEIVYNLRSALDYLTFELACLDTGLDIEGSQFPIESKRKGFKSRINGGWLDGLNSAHVAAIEALQPYRGCQWAAILRDMSNPDKHRTLVPTTAQHEFTIHVVDRLHLDDFRDMPGAISSAVTLDGTEVYVKANLATTILFADGTPVIDKLEEIKTQVSQALDAFKPEFK